jgi:hypothetical protein
MIEAFQYINKAFESKVRLGIMAILMVNEEADFNFLKEQLSLTAILPAIPVPWKNWDISYATKVLSDENHGLFFRQPRKAEKLSNRILKP